MDEILREVCELSVRHTVRCYWPCRLALLIATALLLPGLSDYCLLAEQLSVLIASTTERVIRFGQNNAGIKKALDFCHDVCVHVK